MFNFKKKDFHISSNEITAELLIPVADNTSGYMGCVKFFFIFLFFIFILFKHELHSENNSIKHILILHSYSQGLRWTDNEDRGIRSAFSGRLFEIELHTEYMNTKLLADEKYFLSLYSIFKRSE